MALRQWPWRVCQCGGFRSSPPDKREVSINEDPGTARLRQEPDRRPQQAASLPGVDELGCSEGGRLLAWALRGAERQQADEAPVKIFAL